MAVLSAFTMIRLVSVFHLTLAYYFLVSPVSLSEQNIVFIMGEAMHIPRADPFPKSPTSLSGLAAVAFAFLAFCDFTAAGMTDYIAYQYWGSQTPVRLLFLFGLTAYAYVLKPTDMSSKFAKASPGDSLKNGVIFTWAFLEMGAWMLIYLAVREERKNATRIPREDKDE